MDFMKVFDQTVRDIQREVNLRVLKVPEIEQKVLDATCNEPWGPHGSALSEIAHATKKFADCQMVMNVLWARLTDTGRNWRHVYKALAVIEYLVANGSERAVDDIVEHTFQISSLSGFEYVEPNGKDMGINVRKKAETILGILNNKDKIEEARKKATANREKYVGVSSTGMTYKSSASSYGGSSSYGGFGNSKEDDHTFDKNNSGEDIDWNRAERPRPGARRGRPNESGEINYNNKPSSKEASKSDVSPSVVTQSDKGACALPTIGVDDFDDFDPRGTSSTIEAAGTYQVDLFGGSLIDLMDEPAPAPAATKHVKTHVLDDSDLFADADFLSAAPHGNREADTANQPNVDLFGQQSASFATPAEPFASFTSLIPDKAPATAADPFASFTSLMPDKASSSKLQSTSTDRLDLFSGVPSNQFDGSDLFGDFTSSNAPDTKSSDHKTTAERGPQIKKDAFQVKSGIWADSISRGLIDLNISTRGIPDNSANASAYMGQSLGFGLGPSRPGH